MTGCKVRTATSRRGLLPRFRVYHPTHGPQVWLWWKLFTVSIVRGSHDPFFYFWMVPRSWNVWIYSRWGAWCWSYVARAGVYDSDALHFTEGYAFRSDYEDDPRPASTSFDFDHVFRS